MKDRLINNKVTSLSSCCGKVTQSNTGVFVMQPKDGMWGQENDRKSHDKEFNHNSNTISEKLEHIIKQIHYLLNVKS